MSGRRLALGAAGAALALAVWFFSDRFPSGWLGGSQPTNAQGVAAGNAEQGGPVAESAEQGDDVEPVQEVADELIEAAPQTPAAAPDKREQVGRWGRVTAEGGAGLAPSPLVAVQALRDPALIEEPASGNWGAELGEPLTVEGGRYRIDDTLAGFPEAVVIASHPSHFPAAALLPDEGAAPDLVLASAPALTARVVDGRGEAVEGATVECWGTVTLPNGRRCVHGRRDVVDAQGRLALHPMRGVFQVRAFTERGSASPIWTGTVEDAGDEIDLVLSAGFTLSGRVLDPPDPEYGGYRVLVRSPDDHWETRLAETPVGADGTFEIPSVPIDGRKECLVRLEGSGLCPVEERIWIPAPGERVSVELTCREGIAIGMRMVCDGEPVGGVKTVAYWWEGDAWVPGPVAFSDENGEVVCGGLRPGGLRVRASKPGYQDAVYGPWDVLNDDLRMVEFPLPRARALAGVVKQDGEPVTEFDVRFWVEGEHSTVRHFTHRDDGTFELNTVPAGRVWVEASTLDLPPCKPIAVDVPEDPDEKPEPVELSLESGWRLSGRVIDARSGLPIEGAKLQVFATTPAMATLGPWGQPMLTDADGRFSALPAPTDAFRLTAQAPGYELVLVDHIEPQGPNGDIGSVALSRTGDLTVRLEAAPGTDFSLFKVRVQDPAPSPLIPFPASGEVVVHDVATGHVTVSVFPPDINRVDVAMLLRPGAKWSVTIPIRHGTPIEAKLALAPGVELPDDVALWLRGRLKTPSGHHYIAHARFDDQLRAVLESGTPGPTALEVVTGGGEVLASQVVIVGEGLEQVTIPITGEELVLRLVDGKGEPLPGVVLLIADADREGAARWDVRTDGEGQVTLRDLVANRISVQIGTTLSSGALHIIDLSSRSESGGPIEIVFDPKASLNLRLVEGDQPAADVRLGMHLAETPTVVRHGVSDGGGGVRFDSCEEGSYVVTVEGGGWFPDVFTLEAQVDPPPHDLAVRRRGVLSLSASQEGLPVAGAQVQLTSLQEGDDLLAWQEEGVIGVEPKGWSTGADGTLRIEGLPSGPYTFTVVAPGGHSVQGEALVKGGVVTQAQAVFVE